MATACPSHAASGRNGRIRGGAPAIYVDPEKFPQFHQHLEKARNDLEKAYTLEPRNPIAPAKMIAVGTGLGFPKEECGKWFQRAIDADDGYYIAYYTMLWNLTPKWGGSESELFSFARDQAEKAPPGSTRIFLILEAHSEMLDYVNHYLDLLQKSNVETVHTKGGVPDIPDESCDLIFARNVFHHLDNPTMFFLALRSKLKPSGRIAILDYKPSKGFSFISLFKHHTDEDEIVESLDDAGFQPLKTFDFLKKQSFTIFERKTENQ